MKGGVKGSNPEHSNLKVEIGVEFLLYTAFFHSQIPTVLIREQDGVLSVSLASWSLSFRPPAYRTSLSSQYVAKAGNVVTFP